MDHDRPILVRLRRWGRRWIANPITSIALGTVLVGDALTLPRYGNPTVVGSVIESLASPGWIRRQGAGPMMVYIADDAESMRVIDPGQESWDGLSRLLSDGETPIASCRFVYGTSRHGVWSHVTERVSQGVFIEPMTGTWTPDDLDTAHRTLFDERTRALPCWNLIQGFERVPMGFESSTRILWGGVAHDAFALLTLCGLLYSFSGWPAWFAAHPWSRRNRRLLRDLCPACGYDTRGLTTCPECGTPSEPRAQTEPRV